MWPIQPTLRPRARLDVVLGAATGTSPAATPITGTSPAATPITGKIRNLVTLPQ
jgi:hypothetical protein